MRTFLLTIFWITSLGSVIPMFIWIKTFIVALLGSVGHWILTIPILIIAPLKLVIGTIIGLWAYSVAKEMPAKPTRT